MNADSLLALYDRVAEASDAVERLRRFVLDLAVRGKLVEQDPADEPASELLRRMEAERTRMFRAGAIGKKALHPQMAAPPFDLPRTWCWASLGAVFHYDAGVKRNPKSLDSSLWLLELEDIEKGTGRLLKRLRTSGRKPKSTKSQFQVGDILYGKLRPYLNKVIVAREIGYSTTEIVAIRPYRRLSSEYCALALRSPDFVDYVTHAGRGTKMPRLRTEDAVVAPFPLPPLAEQHRIVAKVDELMALCDQLEEARAEREDTRDRLTKASYARLIAPDPDALTFRAHARFAVDALPGQTARADQVKHLRQTILSLAVRGKLVEQDPADEPASELLKRIEAERRRLVKAGAIGKLKPPSPPEGAKTRFDLPAGWAWVPLGHLSQFVTSGSRDWAKYYSDEGAIFVRMGNLSKDHYRLRLDQVQRVKPPVGGEGTRTRLKGGDILISITGNVGMLGLIPDGFGEAYINQHTAMVRPMPEMKGRYLAELFRSPFAQGQFKEPQRGIKNSFRLRDVTQLSIPLPPLTEQRRIVAKVDELMALCDQLEAGLDAADGTRSRLLEALLQEAVACRGATLPGTDQCVARIGA